MSVDFSVKGRHVLITGGTGGIGAAFAEAFLQAGAVVTIVDIAPPRADQSSGLEYEQVVIESEGWQKGGHRGLDIHLHPRALEASECSSGDYHGRGKGSRRL